MDLVSQEQLFTQSARFRKHWREVLKEEARIVSRIEVCLLIIPIVNDC